MFFKNLPVSHLAQNRNLCAAQKRVTNQNGMRHFITLSTAFSLILGVTQAQTTKKIVVNERDSVSGYYLAIEPASHRVSSVLILLPGFADRAEAVFPETKLDDVAYTNDILVVAVGAGAKLYVDAALLPRLNLICQDIIKRYNVRPEQFVLGGFSAGGTIALRYAELCKESPNQFPINPKGVFTIDSPVDLVDLWAYFDREIAKNVAEVGVSEARSVQQLMAREHGTPTDSLQTYRQLTPFYRNMTEPGNERHLRNTAVRVYHDVDINWYLRERRRSAFDANFAASSEMINRLLLQGNQKAEFIQSDRKGIRSNGTRHPHSWSIVNETACIQWIKSL
jgi:pimeloyl-ACP methyl ester carboxylesterase